MNLSEKDFLLEVGTEEIPSGYLEPAILELKDNFIRKAKELRLNFKDLKTFGTPRRIAIIVYGLEDRQERMVVETLGPPERTGFDEAGNPTKAAVGFARSQGVDVKELKIKETERGRYLIAVKEIPGERTETILGILIPELIQSLHFPKSMRWGTNEFRFVRPIQWILALYGNKPVKCEIAGIRSGRQTYGHRFLSPNSIDIKEPSEYVNRLRVHFCLVDHEERKTFLLKQLQQISKKLKLKINYSDELLSTVINLVEYPVPIVCEIPEKFMTLPERVLSSILNEQQKFFTTTDLNGHITRKFVAVSNNKPRTFSVLRTGYERVVSARLADADFFFKEDLKVSLQDRVGKLKQLIFFDKIGTYHDKVLRLKNIVKSIAEKYTPQIAEKVMRAAELCKADLVTHMVTEFPKLQGVMGMEYARKSGEDDEIAQAIYEHYLPLSAGGELPKTQTGAVLALADKIDNIVAGFILGYTPTGTADPFGYRRQALGIINILLNTEIDISISELCDLAIKELERAVSFDKAGVKKSIIEFFRVRYSNLLASENFQKEFIDSVIGEVELNPAKMKEKLIILTESARDEKFNSLLLAYKRIVNILGKHENIEIHREKLIEPAELELYNAFTGIKEDYYNALSMRKYREALKKLYTLVEPINNFFDRVLVMSEDINLRNNRLGLLNNLKKMFFEYADFSQLPVKNAEVK